MSYYFVMSIACLGVAPFSFLVLFICAFFPLDPSCQRMVNFKEPCLLIENRLVVTKGEGVGGGMEWEFGISRCKLLYIEWINNKVLL